MRKLGPGGDRASAPQARSAGRAREVADQALEAVRVAYVARRKAHVRLERAAEEALGRVLPVRSEKMRGATARSGIARADVAESCRIAHEIGRILALEAREGRPGAFALLVRLVEARHVLEDADRSLAGAVSALGHAHLGEIRAARASAWSEASSRAGERT